METTAEKIVTEALALPMEARAFLAERLIESLDAEPAQPLSPTWRAEVLKRCQDVDRGAVILREAAAVFAKAHSSLA